MSVTDSAAPAFPVRHRYLLLALVGLMVYVPFLGLHDFWYSDEPDIAEAAQTMYVTGDWVTPKRIGVPWVDYPPMIYWTGVASAHLLGFNEFALRLPTALSAVALVLLTCWAGSRWFDAVTGLWAGITLLTFQQFVQQAVGYRPDMIFSLTIAAGLVLYAEGSGDRPRWYLRVAAFACFGLAMLTKGPLGVLLPGLVLTLWLAGRRQWFRILELAPLALVSLAIYLPWFIACARAMGSDNILWELYAQNFARFVDSDRGHGKPLHYFVVNIWGDLAPWSLLLPFAGWWIVRARLWRDRNIQLLLWWFGAFFVFLSLAATKRQLYLLPAYPAAALMIGVWISALLRPQRSVEHTPTRRPVHIYGLVMGGLLVVVAVALGLAAASPGSFFDLVDGSPLVATSISDMRVPTAGLTLVMLLGGLTIAAAGLRRETRQVLVRTTVAHVLIFIVLQAWVLPAANPIKTAKPQGEWIRGQIGNSTHIGLVYSWDDLAFRKMGSFGLHAHVRVELLESAVQVERFFELWPDSIVLIHEDEVDWIFRENRHAWESRIVRELWVGDDRYVVIQGPHPEATQ